VEFAYLTSAEIILGGFIAFVLAVTGYFFYVARKVEASKETVTEEDEYLTGRPEATLKGGTLELVKVKGIGSKMSKKMNTVGINDLRQLASSDPERIAESLGISKDRASRFIKNARSLLRK
jgi:predicted flap endonuclease-1-like 5' DNA nuclease